MMSHSIWTWAIYMYEGIYARLDSGRGISGLGRERKRRTHGEERHEVSVFPVSREYAECEDCDGP